MLFFLSKTLGFIAVPSNLFVMIGLAGIALLPTRFARAGHRLLVTSVVLIAAIGVLPVGAALILPLEERFPPWDPVQGAPTGIIVIGGSINPERSAARGQVALNEAAERLTAAVELARQYPTARIVFSGGSPNLLSGLPEADFAARFTESLGLPRDRITIESQSLETAENAAFTKRLNRAQLRRALVAGHVGLPYATCDRCVSSGRFPSRSLSGRLSNRWPARHVGVFRFTHGGHSQNRCGGPRMVGLIRLLDYRADTGPRSRALIPACDIVIA